MNAKETKLADKLLEAMSEKVDDNDFGLIRDMIDIYSKLCKSSEIRLKVERTLHENRTKEKV
jgi:hypothetical protein